ncbi:hypothetical protein RUM43_001137 [Polyplax serrata]|uniref:High-affinity choline transporter 1 n=1 Tax=Polyplax serrata TaxID=468196 RepID=A0AAN8SEE7_POLSC
MVFFAGLVGIIIFYIAILGVGIWASKKAKNNSEEELMLAGRSLGFVVGTLTLIATWVGGGYINGASEVMFTQGLAWSQVPMGYSVALLVGALLFVKPMRDLNCVTLLDPFQRKYGNRIGAFLFIPSVFGDLFWVGSILNALGSSLVVITELSPIMSIIISVIFVASYTSVGAMYSVTYTDVVQMFFILFGLVSFLDFPGRPLRETKIRQNRFAVDVVFQILSVPFVATNQYVDNAKLKKIDWVGSIPKMDIGEWVDVMLLLIFGGIPWQGYMQRILSIKNTKTAQYLSVISMVGCALMSMPSSYIGVVARWALENYKYFCHCLRFLSVQHLFFDLFVRAVRWDEVPTFERNITSKDASNILPLVLRHLTPPAVAFFGLGAISAAVMSSADSSVLSFSAMFSRNLYKNLIRNRASSTEIMWVLRITVVGISILAAVIALTVPSIYYLSVLSSDLIYVILFPQLLLVIHWNKFVNSYGCVMSYIVGALLRVLGGEHALGLPSVIKYPNFDYTQNKQKFPHRTVAMLSSLATHILVSYIAELLFSKKIIPVKYDFLGCFKVRSGEVSLASLSHNDSAKQLKKAKGTAKKVDTTQKSAADDSEANTSMKHTKKNDS